MDRDVRLATGHGPKEFHKQEGSTQSNACGRPLAPGRAGPVFVTASPVSDERPGTKHTTGMARTDATNGTQRRAAKLEGTKIRFPVPNSFETEDDCIWSEIRLALRSV